MRGRGQPALATRRPPTRRCGPSGRCDRRLETLQAPLEETKAAAKKLGGTLNTAFLTASAAAAGEYHRKVGAPVDWLRASMAISTRTRESGSNSFTLARLLVPTGEMDIAERFAAHP